MALLTLYVCVRDGSSSLGLSLEGVILKGDVGYFVLVIVGLGGGFVWEKKEMVTIYTLYSPGRNEGAIGAQSKMVVFWKLLSFVSSSIHSYPSEGLTCSGFPRANSRYAEIMGELGDKEVGCYPFGLFTRYTGM